jgi:hypothetical protein
VSLSWSAFYGALVVFGSRRTAIYTLWRLVPEAERKPARRRLVIALVDHIREYHERTGRLAPEPDAERDEATR